MPKHPTPPPRENIIRAVLPGASLRAAGEDGAEGPVMFGHFIRWGERTEIDSIFEGNFIESFARGSLKKTFREQRGQIRSLFQHGMDPVVGDKPLGPVDDLREDPDGAYYEVPLLDAAYVRDDILPGLEAGVYGVSFRFRVIREDFNKDPGPSDDNPTGLAERTVREAEIKEFGPVTFPAYEGSTASVRSLTDEFLLARSKDAGKIEELRDRVSVVFARTLGEESPESTDEPDQTEDVDGEAVTPEPDDDERDNAPPTDDAEAEPHLDHGRRATSTHLYGQNPPEKEPSWRL